MDNLEEIDKFLETYNLPRLDQEATDNLNELITSSELKYVIKQQQQQQTSQQIKFKDQMALQGNSTKYKRKTNTYYSQTFPKIEQDGTLSNSFYETTITLIPKPAKDTTRKRKL